MGKGLDQEGSIWVTDDENAGAWIEFHLKEFNINKSEMEIYSFDYKNRDDMLQ